MKGFGVAVCVVLVIVLLLVGWSTRYYSIEIQVIEHVNYTTKLSSGQTWTHHELYYFRPKTYYVWKGYPKCKWFLRSIEE